MRVFNRLLWLSLFILLAIRFWFSYDFDKNVTNYLEVITETTTVGIVKDGLRVTIDYLEEKNLTEGYTSIFKESDDENVGLFYGNLKEYYQGFVKGDLNIVELRGQLIDKDGLIIPSGISIYPYNKIFLIMFFLWGVLYCIFFVRFGYWEKDGSQTIVHIGLRDNHKKVKKKKNRNGDRGENKKKTFMSRVRPKG